MLPNTMTPAFRLAAYLTVCLSIFALAPQSRSQVYQGNQLVKAELLADTNAIVPGKLFTVGLLLRMAPRWHTYWAFSGDAGLPTELKWKLPSGWKVGDIQWPIPLKTIDPGDIETHSWQCNAAAGVTGIDNESGGELGTLRALPAFVASKLASIECGDGKLESGWTRSPTKD